MSGMPSFFAEFVCCKEQNQNNNFSQPETNLSSCSDNTKILFSCLGFLKTDDERLFLGNPTLDGALAHHTAQTIHVPRHNLPKKRRKKKKVKKQKNLVEIGLSFVDGQKRNCGQRRVQAQRSSARGTNSLSRRDLQKKWREKEKKKRKKETSLLTFHLSESSREGGRLLVELLLFFFVGFFSFSCSSSSSSSNSSSFSSNSSLSLSA